VLTGITGLRWAWFSLTWAIWRRRRWFAFVWLATASTAIVAVSGGEPEIGLPWTVTPEVGSGPQSGELVDAAPTKASQDRTDSSARVRPLSGRERRGSSGGRTAEPLATAAIRQTVIRACDAQSPSVWVE
jgi:hypothetical protein